MYKSSGGQTSLFDDPTNFIGAKLSLENRWVKMAAMIPWDLIDEKYGENFRTLNVGQPAKAVRMAVGSLIIREKQKVSDEETLAQIIENPYLQWFIGLSEFTDKAPFDKSSMTYFRKRVTPEMLSEVNDYITGRKHKEEDHDNDPKDGQGGKEDSSENIQNK